MNEAPDATRQTVEPGWYPDPLAPDTGSTRWWDGSGWSPEHVRSAHAVVPRPIEYPSAQSYFTPRHEQRSILPFAVLGAAALIAAAATIF